jgi:signal transduction histidine kinase/ActR/RegA family two-component response regulator
MFSAASAGLIERFRFRKKEPAASRTSPPNPLAWHALPPAAQLYVVIVIASGAIVFVESIPDTYPQPLFFALLLAMASLTAIWKVNLPIPLASSSTLSVSYSVKLMALLLLGPRHAVIIAVAAALVQCTYRVKQRYPLYRTIFTMTAEALTMGATGLVYTGLGGPSNAFDISMLAKPLVGTILTYFVANTGLVACAIALSTNRRIASVWRDDFLWTGVTFMVAGSAGAMAAVVIDRGQQWIAVLLLAPIYLTYRTYQLFVGRLEDQRRHMGEMRRMHQETVEALSQAHRAEGALAEEKERLAVMLADMTRLEETRHELLEREQSARASAEQANRLKDQFLAVVSHELRTPLNAILGWAEMLRSGILDESRRERAAQVIHDSAKRQAQLIDDLLDVARIVSGKLRLERTLVDSEEVIREALQVVQPAADTKHIQVSFEADPQIGFISGDKARLQQIVWNLLSNAIKFTPEGGAVRVHVRQVDQTVELTVSDTGQGIAPDFLETVFEPFRQADGSTTRRHAGLGLGLAIVRHLVDAHGGTVTAQSRGEGQGATFMVRLPVARKSGDVAEPTAHGHSTLQARPSEAEMALAGLSVLVVDDDEESRRMVKAQLELFHAVVLTAESARQAFEVLDREHVDVLLSDIGMPHEDGYALIRKLRALHPSAISAIPAAALTAFARDEDRLRALQAGFQLHLAKPIDTDVLVTAVARLSGKLPERRYRRSSTN